ncbi:MAG: mechanosensitive ion channel [Pirellulales bacterium]
MASLAQENERIAALSVGTDSPAEKLQRVNAHVKELKRQLARIKAEFAHVRQVAELSHELGQVLVRQRRELPDLGALEETLRERQEEIGRAKLNLLDLEARRTRLADVAAEAQNALAPLAGDLGPDELAELEPTARELLQARRDFLDDLITDTNAYYNALVLEQDKTERELAQTVRLYRNYIDERVLWVPSYPPHTGLNAGDISAASLQLIDPRNWGHVLGRLVDDAEHNPVSWGVALAVVVLFVYTVRRLRKTIARLGEAAGSLDAGMRPTLIVAVLTLLAASPAPAVLWFLAGRLTAQPGTDPFSRAFAATMLVVAPIWATIAVVRQSLRRGGLAERHFGVPSVAAAPARRALWRLAALALPTAAIAALFDGLEPIGGQASLGRLAFCVAMFCVYRAARLALHPSYGFVVRLLGNEVDESRFRLRRLWYFAACTPPLVLIGLAAAGFYYAAVQLAGRLQATVWLLLACVAVQAVLWRWLAVARRRLARRHAESSSASVNLEATTERVDAATLRMVGGDERPRPRQSAAHLKSIDIQTRRLLNSFGALTLLLGTWLIWADLLPALQFLDRLQLYSYTVAGQEAATGADGAGKIVNTLNVRWITGANVAWAAIILAMTIIAARNLPGLLEITCLQWLPMDQGARYAVVAAARYVIHIAGIVGICSAVGLQWASIQWLAAAMTVGLGFGLQEIFANFISGLIILFERPIRVGDTVTIGDVSGTVARIRGRATTIVDWDRKELIVPNKEFITGKLINWTLTDDVLRTVIRVSIPATSDFDRATALLLQAAKSNPLVLDEPGPSVAFTQVGDGRLDFELRVFSAGLDALTPLRYQLNAAVLRTFVEAGIEMATGPKEMILRTATETHAPGFGQPTPIIAAATVERAA